MKRLLHPFDRYRPWFRELARYHRHLSWPGFWVRYEVSRLWSRDHEPPENAEESELRAFYAACEYLLYRQVYYHRDRSFRWITKYLPDSGNICEYGCGVAPVTTWLADRRYHYTLVDIPNPALTYARWRLARRGVRFDVRSPGLGNDLPLQDSYGLITCLEVLEHVPNPAEVVRHLIAHLTLGGRLLVNFVQGEPKGLNLASAQRDRKAAMDLLGALYMERPMDADGGGVGVYRA